MALSNNTSINEYNTTKWGKVLVFIRDNYATFTQSCTIALVNAKAQTIINKTKDMLNSTTANAAAIACCEKVEAVKCEG